MCASHANRLKASILCYCFDYNKEKEITVDTTIICFNVQTSACDAYLIFWARNDNKSLALRGHCIFYDKTFSFNVSSIHMTYVWFSESYSFDICFNFSRTHSHLKWRIYTSVFLNANETEERKKKNKIGMRHAKCKWLSCVWICVQIANDIAIYVMVITGSSFHFEFRQMQNIIKMYFEKLI